MRCHRGDVSRRNVDVDSRLFSAADDVGFPCPTGPSSVEERLVEDGRR